MAIMNLTPITTSCLTILAIFSFLTVNGSPVPTRSEVDHRQQEHSRSKHHKNTFLSEVDDNKFESREIRSQKSSFAENDVKQPTEERTPIRSRSSNNSTIEKALRNAVEEVQEQKKFEMIEDTWKNDFMLSFQQQLRQQLMAQGYGDMLA
jgi:hypothetical protein